MKIDFRTSWRDWTVFGLLWVILIGTTIAIYANPPDESPLILDTGAIDASLLIIPLAIGIVANLIYGAVIAIKGLNDGCPYVLVAGSWAMAAGFGYISGGDPIVVLGGVGALMVASLLRLEVMFGIVQVFGAVIAAFAAASIPVSSRVLEQRMESGVYTVPAILLVLLGTVMSIWTYIRDNQKKHEARGRQDEYERRLGEIANMV